MNHDPLYRQIIRALNELSIDPYLFESCAADLINKSTTEFSVAAVPGGSDKGMDGAMADGKGDPYPIVATVGDGVIDNMTRNLNEYIADGRSGRKTVVATTRVLSNHQKNNLRNRAGELGFTLINIYDQESIARMLYRDPPWRKDLLGLSGSPSALSAIPLTWRPESVGELIGREAAMDWLKRDSADKVLVGEPGSGKTALLVEFTRDESQRAFFVVSSDRAEIADAIRELEPKYLMVDDAHTIPDFIMILKLLRQQIKSEFSIIATCWQRDVANISRIMSVKEEHVYHLPRLTQNQMVDVIAAGGIKGINWLIQEIIRQSEGLPGLAVTLAKSAIQHGVKRIISADALMDSMQSSYLARTSQEVKHILASFSVGGKAGMSQDVVAQILGVPELHVVNSISHVSVGGIITAARLRPGNTMVRPAALRYALIRDSFFNGVGSLSERMLQALIDSAPDLAEVTRELIEVRLRGDNVPLALLQSLVLQFPKTIDIWERYAGCGPKECSWVLDHFEGDISLIAASALDSNPEDTIRALLNEPVLKANYSSSLPEPIRSLRNWVRGVFPSYPECMQRRQQLFKVVQHWILSTDNQDAGITALMSALSPSFETAITQPGYYSALILRRGYLEIDQLRQLHELWKDFIALIDKFDLLFSWASVMALLNEYLYGDPSLNVPEIRDVQKEIGRQMVNDILPRISAHSGWLYELRKKVSRSELKLNVQIDPLVEVLYPIEEGELDYKERDDKWRQSVNEVTSKLIEDTPLTVLNRIAEIERTMNESSTFRHPWLTRWLCEALASRVDNIAEWTRASFAAEMDPELVLPFVTKLAIDRPNGWENLIHQCFKNDKLTLVATSVVLTLTDISSDLEDQALNLDERHTRLLAHLVESSRIPTARLVKLFRVSDSDLSGTLAIAEWNSIPRKSVRGELHELWEAAILSIKNVRTDARDFDLAAIFESSPSLGFQWLKLRLQDGVHFYSHRFEKTISAILVDLEFSHRCELLDLLLDERYGSEEIVWQIVGHSPELYEYILANKRLSAYHLVPLFSQELGSNWQKMALLALEYGYSEKEVVSHTVTPPMVEVTSGLESELWKSWLLRFQNLNAGSNSLVAIKNAGIELCNLRLTHVLRSEFHEAVYGED